MWLRRLLQVSALKTVRFNIHYFGLQGLIRMPVLVARNYFFRTLRGGGCYRFADTILRQTWFSRDWDGGPEVQAWLLGGGG